MAANKDIGEVVSVALHSATVDRAIIVLGTTFKELGLSPLEAVCVLKEMAKRLEGFLGVKDLGETEFIPEPPNQVEN